MNVDHKVRDQLILSRQLLAEPDYQDSASADPSRSLHDLMVSYGAAELALAAICVQLDCVPDKKDICLPDYFDSLRKAVYPELVVQGMDYVAELHKVRSDSQLRFLLPDPRRWTRVKEETLEYVAGWCQQCLGLRLFDLNSVPTASLATPAFASESAVSKEQPGSLLAGHDPVRRRYDCVGSADIRLARKGRSEKGRIANLSAGGCYVKTEFVFEVGEQVEMILQVNKMSFRVAGNVVHVPSLGAAGKGKASDSGMGVQFKNMTAGARSRLQELIAELKTNRIFRVR